jgi:hypothetical protein
MINALKSVKIQMNKTISEPLKHIPEDIELKNTIITFENELKLKDNDVDENNDDENSSGETSIGKYIVETRTKIHELLVKVTCFLFF